MIRKLILGAAGLAFIPLTAQAAGPSLRCVVGTHQTFVVTGSGFTPGVTYTGVITTVPSGGDTATTYTSVAGEFNYTGPMYHRESIKVGTATCSASIVSPR